MTEPPEIEFNSEPKDAASFMKRGNIYFEQRELDLALADYDMAIQLDPMLKEAYHQGARAYKRQGNLDGAIAVYSKAIEVNPRHMAFFYIRRAMVYERQGKLEHAIADYTKLIELVPEEAESCHFWRGDCYLNHGDLENATADYDSAIRLGYTGRDVHNNRGIVLSKQGRLEEAAADFEKAVKKTLELNELRRSGRRIMERGGPGILELNDVTAYSIRGGVFFAYGAAEEALSDFEAALRLEPENRSIMAGRAISLHAVGRVDDATAAWQWLVELDERFRDADWAGKELGWRPELIEEARKVIAAI